MQMILRFLLALSVLSAAPQALAQIESAKGTGTVSYSWSLGADDKTKALHDAEVNAVERYVAEHGAAQSQNFDVIRDKVSSSINDYVLSSTILSEDNRKDAKQYSVVIRADINTARLNNAFKASSAVTNTAAAQKSPLTFVFVARQQDSVKSFDTHVYSRTDHTDNITAAAQGSQTGTEGEHIKKGSVGTSSSASGQYTASQTTSSIDESGGSKLRKADQVTWALMPTASINSVVTGVFSSAGYDVVDAEYVEPSSNGLLSLKALRSDYQTGNDLQPQTLRNTVQGLQAAQVPYLALATLDVSTPDTDPSTGLVRINVTVSGKILDVTGRFPRTLSSVGPVQFAGTGPSTDVAQTNALKLAADSAAHELVSQINAAGIH